MMRDLKECQAEVFRRSEKRIEKRKRRRKQILMACVPMVLCAAMVSFVEVPEPGDENTGAAGAVMDMMPEYSSESLSCRVVRIEVSGGGGSWAYTDTGDLLAISGQLEDYAVRAPESNGSTQEETRGLDRVEDDRNHSISDSAAAGYAIILFLDDGTATEYRLAGNKLTNIAKRESCLLTPREVNELNDLLGISDSTAP